MVLKLSKALMRDQTDATPRSADLVGTAAPWSPRSRRVDTARCWCTSAASR
ncbi:hypothetical protein ACFQVA_20955 [Actinomadura keratinilytica]